MSQTALTAQQFAVSGLAASYGAGNADGSRFLNTGKQVLHFKNVAVAVDVIVTIVTPGTVDGLAVTDRTVTVTHGTEKFIGPFPPQVYNQGSGTYRDYVFITYDGVADLTVALLELP